jgi:hypothetical protein
MYIYGGYELTWPEQYEGPFEDMWRFDVEKQYWEEIRLKGTSVVNRVQC